MKTPFKIAAQFNSSFRLTLLAAFICQCHLLLAAPRAHDAKPRPTATKKQSEKLVYAVWYNVPPNSLARRRAKLTELTAAHNRLPLGTLVRVTRLSNAKTVVVRITDRGITNRRASIDICREAAEELGMIREGICRVQLEIIPEPALATAPGPDHVAAH